jgi:hypothetical protein
MITLTNVGSTYDAIDASLGLGLGYFNLTGVTAIDFLVKVKKIGTGTQSWQLWSETDGSEIGVITDAAAAGAAKNLTATFNVSLTGVKLLRIRAKSTVSTDDPLFLGGAISLR